VLIGRARVKRIAKRVFALVDEKDCEALLKDCAPNVYHRFSGQHALGGQRHDRETFRRWLDRLGRLVPNVRLTAYDVWVKGWRHNTAIIIRWSATDTLSEARKDAGYVNAAGGPIRETDGAAITADAPHDRPPRADHGPSLGARSPGCH
jgi:ketosteroid isomerase-like protein